MLREKLTKSNRSLVLCENNSSITDQCSTVVPGKVILRASDQLLNSDWTPEYPILSTSWMHIEQLNSTFCPTYEYPLNSWMSHPVQLLNSHSTSECPIPQPATGYFHSVSPGKSHFASQRPTSEVPLNTWRFHSVQLLNAHWKREYRILSNSWMVTEPTNVPSSFWMPHDCEFEAYKGRRVKQPPTVVQYWNWLHRIDRQNPKGPPLHWIRVHWRSVCARRRRELIADSGAISQVAGRLMRQ